MPRASAFLEMYARMAEKSYRWPSLATATLFICALSMNLRLLSFTHPLASNWACRSGQEYSTAVARILTSFCAIWVRMIWLDLACNFSSVVREG